MKKVCTAGQKKSCTISEEKARDIEELKSQLEGKYGTKYSTMKWEH